ncbi:hypothetical protein HMPREF1326_00654 [Akkermansia sp. KLE1605]|nr:hypothetical protein HMPREF1326_00654 [Akkermansia sp. KLE1605]
MKESVKVLLSAELPPVPERVIHNSSGCGSQRRFRFYPHPRCVDGTVAVVSDVDGRRRSCLVIGRVSLDLKRKGAAPWREAAP